MQECKKGLHESFLSGTMMSLISISDYSFQRIFMLLGIIIVVGIVAGILATKVFKDYNIPLTHKRIIESVIMLIFPLIIISKWFGIPLTILQLSIFASSSNLNQPKSTIKYFLVSFIGVFAYVAFFTAMISEKHIEYRPWILGAYYLWSAFYVWKLQVVEYQLKSENP